MLDSDFCILGSDLSVIFKVFAASITFLCHGNSLPPWLCTRLYFNHANLTSASIMFLVLLIKRCFHARFTWMKVRIPRWAVIITIGIATRLSRIHNPSNVAADPYPPRDVVVEDHFMKPYVSAVLPILASFFLMVPLYDFSIRLQDIINAIARYFKGNI